MCNFTHEIINSCRDNIFGSLHVFGGLDSGFFGGPVDFLIHWPPGPVVATVQCQGVDSLFQIETITMLGLGSNHHHVRVAWGSNHHHVMVGVKPSPC